MVPNKNRLEKFQEKEVPTPSDFINKRIVFAVLGLTAIYCLTSDASWALQADDAMKATSEALEKTLTGSWLRIGLLAGMIGGVVMSAVKQSPIIFAGSMGTGLGALYYKGWVTDSFAALI